MLIVRGDASLSKLSTKGRLMDPIIDRYLHEYDRYEEELAAARIVDYWRMQARHKYYLEPQDCADPDDEDFWALADIEDEDMYDELERY